MNIAVLGPTGRMGRLVADGVVAAGDLTLCGLLDRAGCGTSSLHGVAITESPADALKNCDVYIDFSTPAASISCARAAASLGIAAVVGTTGLGAEGEAALDELAGHAPLLVASNFSLGVNVLDAVVEIATRALGPSYDAEIVELHHKRKLDAPSGTALSLAEAVGRGRDQLAADVSRYCRHGQVGARPDGEIGVQAVRGGDIVGEHTVYLIGENERVELTHRAQDRRLFADGALAAARWLVGKPPGRYQMRDVLGLAAT